MGPRSLVHRYIASCLIKRDKTSWTYSIDGIFIRSSDPAHNLLDGPGSTLSLGLVVVVDHVTASGYMWLKIF